MVPLLGATEFLQQVCLWCGSLGLSVSAAIDKHSLFRTVDIQLESIGCISGLLWGESSRGHAMETVLGYIYTMRVRHVRRCWLVESFLGENIHQLLYHAQGIHTHFRLAVGLCFGD